MEVYEISRNNLILKITFYVDSCIKVEEGGAEHHVSVCISSNWNGDAEIIIRNLCNL